MVPDIDSFGVPGLAGVRNRTQSHAPGRVAQLRMGTAAAPRPPSSEPFRHLSVDLAEVVTVPSVPMSNNGLVDAVARALGRVVNPVTGQDVVEGGQVADISVGERGDTRFVFSLQRGDPGALVRQARAAAEAVEGDQRRQGGRATSAELCRHGPGERRARRHDREPRRFHRPWFRPLRSPGETPRLSTAQTRTATGVRPGADTQTGGYCRGSSASSRSARGRAESASPWWRPTWPPMRHHAASPWG